MQKKNIFFVIFSVLLFAIGFFTGQTTKQKLNTNDVSKCNGNFKYINPNLGCSSESFDKSYPITLVDDLNKFISDSHKNGDTQEVSVYFRDLKDGPVFGINENDLFISASLLKLPIALTFYRLSEDGAQDILKRKILYKQEGVLSSPSQFFKPLKSAISGQSYLISDLIYYSLVYSDNASNEILKTYLKDIGKGEDLLLTTFKDLGLTEPTSLVTNDISTRGYASIFRILYNASYLSKEDSESVLSILDQSEFSQGIVSGVPNGVRVSNKFGERDLGNIKQLHDCGIVYFKDNPYVLCVMTRGKDFNSLTKVISKISNMVYTEMEQRSKK
jgi:beta-lactamase class A